MHSRWYAVCRTGECKETHVSDTCTEREREREREREKEVAKERQGPGVVTEFMFNQCTKKLPGGRRHCTAVQRDAPE